MTIALVKTVKELITQHGVSATFVAITTGGYDSNSGAVTNTETETSITTYPNRLRVTQYNYPSLIGKEVTEFLIAANDLSAKPKPDDKIKVGTTVYTVMSTADVIFEGSSVLYKALSVR